MPVTVEKRGDEYCVVRSGNSRQGEHTIACYKSKDQAEKRKRSESSASARAGDTDAPVDWYRFVENKADPKVAEIHIYGDIGETMFGDGVSAAEFVDTLEALDVDDINLRINSPGGSAWDGLTIANAIIRHKAHVTTWIDGLAASAASIVAVAGDDVVVSKYGQAMLHNARAVVMGTAKDMRETAQQLDQLNGSMAQYYADRAGGDAAEWSRAMGKETWYNAEEMLAAGLATRIDSSAVREEVEQAAASAMAGTAEQYRYLGRTAAPPPIVGALNRTKGTTMASKDDLAKRLGKDPADVTDEDLFAAALAAIGADGDKDGDDKGDGKPDEAPKTDEKPIVDAPPEPVKELAGAAAHADTVTVDAGTYAELKRRADLGAQAHATLQAQADARTIDSAIDAGKIPLARRDNYLVLMSADRPGTTDLLAKLQPGGAVPLNEMGHSADANPVASVTEDPQFQAWKVG